MALSSEDWRDRRHRNPDVGQRFDGGFGLSPSTTTPSPKILVVAGPRPSAVSKKATT